MRRKAAFALGRIGGDPYTRAKALAQAFKDSNEDVRQSASNAIARLGSPAVPTLIELLKSNNAQVSLPAATSLGDIREDAKNAVPALRDRVLAKDTEHARHYALALARIGRVAAPAMGMKDARPAVHAAAVEALGQMGGDGAMVLVDGLNDKNVHVRRVASNWLALMQVADKPVVIALGFGMQDEDDAVRVQCAMGLGFLGRRAGPAVPQLELALTDMHPEVRARAYHVLTVLGERPQETLLAALKSKDDRTRINAAAALVLFSVATDEAILILKAALTHKDLALRVQGCTGFWMDPKFADPAIPILLDGIKHKSAGVREQSASGLVLDLKGKHKVDLALAEAVDDPDPNVRQAVINALRQTWKGSNQLHAILARKFKMGDARLRVQMIHELSGWMFGPNAKEIRQTGLQDKNDHVKLAMLHAIRTHAGHLVIEELKLLTKDKSRDVRYQLVDLLARPEAQGVAVLGEMLRSDPDAIVRVAVMQRIRMLGVETYATLVPAIQAAAKDRNAHVRAVALGELIHRSEENRHSLAKALIECLKDADAEARQNAAYALSNLGTDAADALPLLRQLIEEDPDGTVRTHARDSYIRISDGINKKKP